VLPIESGSMMRTNAVQRACQSATVSMRRRAQAWPVRRPGKN
jgi:hypothetical protein